MQFIDVDNDPRTFNSSRATVNLPPGANVIWAGLYWGGDTSDGASDPTPNGRPAPSPDQRNQVLFATPTAAGYTTLLASEVFEFPADESSPGSDGVRYQGFREVTRLVQAAGEGSYTVANVQAGNGQTLGGLYGGWALVVVFQDPNGTLRNLTVFDGLTEVRSFSEGLTVTVDGFVTPALGNFNARIGAVTYEGDIGLVGDGLEVNGLPVGNDVSPVNNFFNSAINGPGSEQREPRFVNQLGLDLNQFIVPDPSSVLGNNSESARFRFNTDGDAYFPGVLSLSIDTVRPVLEAFKTVRNLDGDNSNVRPGDRLEYTIRLENTGDDSAANLILKEQVLPENTTYIPDSLQVIFESINGPQTDPPGDDLAEFDVERNAVQFRLGRGASAEAGGTLLPGEAAEVSLQVRVNDGTLANTRIENQAIARFTGLTLGETFEVETDSDLQTPGPQPTITIVQPVTDLSLLKRITAIQRDGLISRFDQVEGSRNPAVVGRVRLGEDLILSAGDRIEYTIYFQVEGNAPVPNIRICDPLPAPLAYVPNSLRLTRPDDNGAVLLSDGADGDAGRFVPALTPTELPCPNESNPTGAVFFDVGTVEQSAGDGLGWVQFEALVEP